MKLRLTDGSEFELVECNQECDPETNENILNCVISKDYDFNDVVDVLKKNEIAEIISVLDKNGFIFQSNDYAKVLSITNDIQSGLTTVKFINKNE